jgi:hypothetical protein
MTSPTSADVRAALHALGSTADEVANTLLVGGYRGTRNKCSACPVAAYLAAKFPDYTPLVGPGEVRIAKPGDVDWLVYVDMPDPVAQFVHAFDDAIKYRELEVAA